MRTVHKALDNKKIGEAYRLQGNNLDIAGVKTKPGDINSLKVLDDLVEFSNIVIMTDDAVEVKVVNL